MIPKLPLYLYCARAVFALQIARQATTSYTNTSASVGTLTSTTPGPFCCEVYAQGVQLHRWYTGPDPKVVDQIIVTEFLHYNSTFSHGADRRQAVKAYRFLSTYCVELPTYIPICPQLRDRRPRKQANQIFTLDTIVPTSTITTFPTDTVREMAYLADVDGPAPIPGLPTNLNGPYYGGAYDATYVENATSTVYTDNSTTS